jgi:hypothetical protein
MRRLPGGLMSRQNAVLGVAVVALLLCSCSNPATPDPSYRTIDATLNPDVRPDTDPLVIRDTNLWRRYVQTPPDPPVDFGREMVVVIWKDTPTPCYRVRLERVTRNGAEVVLKAVLQIPGPSCVCVQVVGRPFAVFAMPRADTARAEWSSAQTVGCPS